MTERRVGGDGLHVDVKAGQSRVGSDGLNVDVVPGPIERRTDSVGVTLDVTLPPLAVSAFGLRADIKASTATRLGNIGLLVDYVPSLIPTTAVRWSGTLFEMGTSSPVVRWAGSAFDTSGSAPIVIWNLDHFELAP